MLLWMLLAGVAAFAQVRAADGFGMVTRASRERHEKWWNGVWERCTSLEGAPEGGVQAGDIMHEQYWAGAARECMSQYLVHDWMVYVSALPFVFGAFALCYITYIFHRK